MDAKRTFLNELEQTTRQDPSTGALSSPDITIVHAAYKNRCYCEPLDILSSDHRPILIVIHLPTEKVSGEKRFVLDWKKGDLAAFASAAEQLRRSGLTDGESLTEMYRSFCKVVLAAARKHIGLKVLGMTGE